ncbi:hypothetical protein LTR37_004111 [Vermiconidia calcicola]|uniref:Uncharacterized protein n=1 Tax=Vermiconidia calcicola TaxID=1690605 RepID=A0ACC3NN01_9PEZI|nr:hypothetical protein LTR37_004111 [Vermiconidia calcicola]
MFALPRNYRLPSLFLILAFGFITTFFYYRSSIGQTISDHAPSYRPNLLKGRIKAANATLGFGGLYVVSGLGSPRRAHLEQAAAVTELELVIPEQRVWTEEDVLNFRWDNVTESLVGIGSVKAWLSHHLVLRAFLESGAETALIFEDDVDWDIRLRTVQVPLAQQAARSLSLAPVSSAYPWGMHDDWDLLYLGHCGDYFNDLEDGVGVGHHHPHHLTQIPHAIFEDPSMPDRTDLHPFTASLLTALNVPEHNRVLHRSKWPLCSFGYAVTRQGAEKILTEVAPPKEDISRKLIAYDAALLDGCRDGYLLNCYSITPELFHHMEGKSLIAIEEEAREHHHVFRPPVDVKGMEQVYYRKETSNIGCGFWSGEFYFDGKPEKLEVLREEVGRKGRCIKDGRENEYHLER